MTQNMDETKKIPEKSALLMNTQELSEEALFLEELRQLAGMEEPATQVNAPQGEARDEQPRQRLIVEQMQKPLHPAAEQEPLRSAEASTLPQRSERRASVTTDAERQNKAGFWKGFAMVAASTAVMLATIIGVLIGLHTAM